MEQESIKDQFEFNIHLPSRLKNIGIWTLTILYGALLFTPLGIPPALGLLLFMGYGFIMGRFWIWMSNKLVNWTILNPLRSRTKNEEDVSSIQRFYLNRFLTKRSDRAFLQVSTKDRDISTWKAMFSEFFQPIFSFLAILATFTQFYVNQFGGTEADGVVLGFLFAFPILGIYVPYSMIIEDARIMNVNPDGSVEFLGGRLRRLIDGFFGITGLISGYTLVINRSDSEGLGELIGIAISSAFQYVFVIIAIIVISIPIMIPTLMTYYQQHSYKVNEFRREAMKLKIYPAKTSVERLTGEEIKEIVIGEEEQEPDEDLISRIKTFLLGKRTLSTEQYTQDQIDDLTLHGAWICKECNHVNTGIDTAEFCLNCGSERLPDKMIQSEDEDQ